ncbi:MAG: response regulator [Myxococcales bacterium]|nr:MAG: response regulator [Myxococcales bacterium]
MSMVAVSRPRVICVDDEPHVVGGLALHLRRRYEVELATSAQAGLELLDREPSAAVVISDMRMPGMNGSEFLARARAAHPETTRVLLTGYAEIDAATRAINEGRVFRFLVKPCPPPELLRTVEAAAELHRVTVSERELLESTVQGSVQMLSDIMAVTNPAAFGRANRVKQLVTEVSLRLGDRPGWQLEVAALLSQLSSLALPHETVEKLYYGAPLSSAERAMVERAPEVTQQLLGHIPRLDVVRRMLAGPALHRPVGAEIDPEEQKIRHGAQLLKGATQLDVLEAQGMSSTGIAAALKAAAQDYDPQVLEALLEVCAARPGPDSIREVPLSGLEPGMVLAADVKTTTGALFAARGYEVTASFLERAGNFRAGSIKEPLKVFAPK